MKKLIFSFLGLLLLGCAIPTWAGKISGTVSVQGGGAWPDESLYIALARSNNNTSLGLCWNLVSAGSYSFDNVSATGTLRFGLSRDGEYPFLRLVSDWVFVESNENVWEFEYSGDEDITIDIVIKPAGGDDPEPPTPKATLLGAALLESNCNMSSGINVSISGNDCNKSTTTDWGEDYSDKLGCMYGYAFKDLDLGTYTLTYSKSGYETKTQQITIDAEGEKIAPTVSLEAEATEYSFNGNIHYVNTNNVTVYVEDATVTAYDGDGADAQVLGTATTNASGRWEMKLNCKRNQSIYFWAEHPSIVVAARQQVEAVTPDGQTVNISCTEKLPDLLPVETYKAKQMGTVDVPLVEISWTWPKEFLDKYKTASNPNGVYTIRAVKIFRPVGMAGLTEVGQLEIAENTLPGTSFVDGNNADYRLIVGQTYQYTIRLCYTLPIAQDIDMPGEGEEPFTITLSAELAMPDSVNLTLNRNDETMGTVEGAGRYEKGDQVIIRAKANRGYLFKEWQKNDETYATAAEYKLKLTEDMTLTAIFEEKPAVLDSVNLTLYVNDAKMGTVQGAGRYAKGEEVTINATPNAGYAFKQWKSGNKVLSTAAQYTFLLNTDSAITAVFERKIEYRGMVNYKAKQVNNSVRLTWEWPQELVDDYAKSDGTGIYQIFRVNIFRINPGEQYPVQVGFLMPQAYTLPATVFVDDNAEYPLQTDSTYIYYFEVAYDLPAAQTVTVRDDDKLTIKLESDPGEVTFVTLSLQVNDETMGKVTGAGQYEVNEEVTIRATANEGYVFKAWVAGQDTIARTSAHRVKMVQDSTLTAVFTVLPVVADDSVTIALSVNDEAMGTVTGAGKYEKGTSVKVVATANAGYVFKAWKEGNVSVSAEATYQFVAQENRTLTAEFAVAPVVDDSVTIALSVNDEAMGTVTGAGKYEKGASVKVVATANAGYVFKAWKEGNASVSAEATYQFVAQENRTLTAEFAVAPVVVDSVTLTLEVNNTRMGMVEGAGRYEKGAEVAIKATAYAGYSFVAWISGGDTVAKTAEYKLVLNSDSTLVALFEEEVSNESREQAAWNAYAENQTIVLQSNTACQYDVYNMAGTLVKQAKVGSMEYRISVNNSGLYIIRRISATGYSVKKVMVR